MESIYVSPSSPRLTVETEADLDCAIAEGLLEETHYLDLKRELEPGKAKNKEHARDLASFAIDGGNLLVGLDEDKQRRTVALAPQPLDGLRERVESIARAIPDPPLPVIVRAIASTSDPTVGYLVVHVPPSPAAPHMVDNRYFGRGDTQKQYLSDAEVLRLHERRRVGEADALALLDREVARDPVPADVRQQAHLFLVAEPLTPRSEMFLPNLDAQVLTAFLRRGAYAGTAKALGQQERFSPDLGHASRYSRRSDGAALSSHNMSSERSMLDLSGQGSWDEDLVDVEFGEDGDVRIVMTRLSDRLRGDGPNAGLSVIFDEAAVVYVRRLLALVVEIADATGYLGGWQLAAGGTGLKGLSSYEHVNRFGGRYQAQFFEDNVYRRATIASYAELTQVPGAITNRLLGRFLRKLGTEALFVSLLKDPELASPDETE